MNIDPMRVLKPGVTLILCTQHPCFNEHRPDEGTETPRTQAGASGQ